MNNIEILEEKIKIIESLCTDDCINKSTVIQPLKYAIENLIKENKELKDTNKKLYELCQGNAMQEFINNECGFIPKSKVKEKIEELKNNCYAESIEFNNELIEILQELLEGE